MTEPVFDKSGNTGLKHLFNATRFSLQGFQSAVANESAFRQELVALCIVLPTGFWFAESLAACVALFCVCMLVLMIELLNSGIEAAIDRIGPEYHELAKNAKDYGSAAVMLALITAGSVWFYILFSAFTQS